MNVRSDFGISGSRGIPLIFSVPIVVSFLIATGCVSLTPPTIAHTHIGHALSGWYDTPNRAGLLNTSEREAEIGHAQAQMAAVAANPDELRNHVRIVLQTFDSERSADGIGGAGEAYGVCKALDGALNHLEFAVTSDDATANVRDGVKKISANTRGLIEKCRLVGELAEEILKTDSEIDAVALTEELPIITGEVVYGSDINGNGVIGDESAEIGISMVRTAINEMTAREDPPYSPVATRWLFSLIRLDDGSWKFSKTENRSARGY